MKSDFQIGIIGGGLAGLSLAILLAKQNMKVALFEKGNYPCHKVCGEYVSRESLSFLKSICNNISFETLPQIDKLIIATSSKNTLKTKLPLGAIGISRYYLDNALFEAAKLAGVQMFTDTKVNKIASENGRHIIYTNSNNFVVDALISAAGKLSVQGLNNSKPTLENYVGVKYHLKLDAPVDTIHLFPFQNGYAGMSAIEDHKFCLCYLVKASELVAHDASIAQLENNLLSKNSAFEQVWKNAKQLWEKPLVISNVYFGQKTLAENNIFYVGDAAGAIPPLAGNGMSMALRSANFLAPIIVDYVAGKIDFVQASTAYSKIWKSNFSNRIATGLLIQKFMCHPLAAKFAVKIIDKLPIMHGTIIRRTHGKPF